MSLTDVITWTQPLFAFFAFCALVCPKPSLSAVFLFIQSVLININLALLKDPGADFLATSILLSFFAMIVIGNNLYLEISHKNPVLKIPKSNIIIGLISIIFLLFSVRSIAKRIRIDKLFDQQLMVLDGTTLIISGFSLFVILVSALTILDIKNSKPGSTS